MVPRSDHRNISKFWSDRVLSGLSLLQADFTTHEYAPHSHDGLVIAITQEGGAVIRSGRELVEARPNVIFISNPGETQSAWMGRSQRWRYRSFYVSEHALSHIARDAGLENQPGFACTSILDPELCEVFLSLHSALTQEHDLFGAIEFLTAAFCRLFARHGAGKGHVRAEPADASRLHLVIELMRQRFQDSLELNDLAELAGLTVFQLIRSFRRMTGFTPHAYLTQLRLNAAREDLRRGLDMAETAIAAGFYDQSALTKHFKRAYGITPGQFATAVRADRRPPHRP